MRFLFTVFAAATLSQSLFAAELLVAAASDLVRFEAPLSRAFQAKTGQSVRFVFGSSGLLARQIENGAPYDVFLSANEDFAKKLAEAGHLKPDSLRLYARGRIALWSKSGKIRTLDALAAPGIRHIAIANPAHAPYGAAARQMLERGGLWRRLESRIVLGENIRQTLQFAESGNADVAIVAWTLVFDRGGILLPEESHNPIRQAAGIVAGSRQPALARAFLDLLTGVEGAALLESLGLFRPTR
jgi:molybdate transport system substrate-binding protein